MLTLVSTATSDSQEHFIALLLQYNTCKTRLFVEDIFTAVVKQIHVLLSARCYLSSHHWQD